jgi:hypothetical protein
MEAIFSSETSVDFERTIWRYIPEDNHRCYNFNFYLLVFPWNSAVSADGNRQILIISYKTALVAAF